MLRRLYLSRNRLRNLPRLTSRSFSHLSILDLHSNQLVGVENDAFAGLVSLDRVQLSSFLTPIKDFIKWITTLLNIIFKKS